LRNNILFLFAGLACAIAGILGYQYYERHHASTGVEINIDDSGVSIKKN
jgi:predicted negative regulator of RcsB-dependent stress response